MRTLVEASPPGSPGGHPRTWLGRRVHVGIRKILGRMEHGTLHGPRAAPQPPWCWTREPDRHTELAHRHAMRPMGRLRRLPDLVLWWLHQEIPECCSSLQSVTAPGFFRWCSLTADTLFQTVKHSHNTPTHTHTHTHS